MRAVTFSPLYFLFCCSRRRLSRCQLCSKGSQFPGSAEALGSAPSCSLCQVPSSPSFHGCGFPASSLINIQTQLSESAFCRTQPGRAPAGACSPLTWHLPWAITSRDLTLPITHSPECDSAGSLALLRAAHMPPGQHLLTVPKHLDPPSPPSAAPAPSPLPPVVPTWVNAHLSHLFPTQTQISSLFLQTVQTSPTPHPGPPPARPALRPSTDPARLSPGLPLWHSDWLPRRLLHRLPICLSHQTNERMNGEMD